MKAIEAVSQNGIMGHQNGIPWRCNADFKHFKEMTMDGDLIFGRTTFDGMPNIKGRGIFVISNSVDPGSNIENPQHLEGICIKPKWLFDNIGKDRWLCGGARIYKQFMIHCDELYLSIIKKDVIGDTRWPTEFHGCDVMRYSELAYGLPVPDCFQHKETLLDQEDVKILHYVKGEY